MKIIILTEAGSDIGLGHLTRCTAICQGFEEKRILPELVVKVAGNFSGKFEYKNYRMFDWVKNDRPLKELLRNTDIAVIDSYLAQNDIYKTICDSVKLGVYFDDTQRLSYPEGVIINGAVEAENISYLQKDGSNFLLGLKYMPLRKVFWDVSEKKINKEPADILVTFGGQSNTNFLEKTLTVLTPRFSGLKWHFVLSSDSSFCPAVIEQADIKIYSDIDSRSMCELMLKCDMCICAGGQTMYELARAGTPAIAVCVAENQKYNLQGWKKAGFINEWFHITDENIFDDIYSEVEALMIAKTRAERSRIGRNRIDGQGTRRIVNFLLEKTAA